MNIKREMDSMYSPQIWDVVVIGGGPAGMMAAGRAAECGARVLLVEKNNTLGKKLLITGGGRCNVTNAEYDTRTLLEKFKENGKFFFSAFSQWDVKDTLTFFHTRGMQTKTENEQRVFPVSNSAQSVWNVLVHYLREGGVTILSGSPVHTIVPSQKHKNTAAKIILKNKKEIHARAVVMATGGISRPETGSTGEGFAWLAKIGHTVAAPTPSLVPIAVKDAWVKQLSGVGLANIKITILQNGIAQNSQEGKILFTHTGLSGPAVLHISKDVGELLKYGEVILSLDMLPVFNEEQLNTKLQDTFKKYGNKKIKNSLSAILPAAITPALITLCKINPETVCNSITRAERLALVKCIKNLPMRAEKLLGADKAIISSGGVALEEIDFKTMRSRLFNNLYIVGDLLNVDRPSGGYSLQLCWTTGWVAGNCAGKKVL